MAELALRRRIEAPADRVFAAVSDLAGAPKRIRGIRRVEIVTPGPLRVGSRFRSTRAMMGRESTEEMAVTSLEPGRRFGFGGESCGCSIECTYLVTPAGAATDLEMRIDWRPLTAFARVLAFLTKPLMSLCMKATERDLDDLKASIESEAAGVAVPASA